MTITAGRTFRESRLRARDGYPLDEEERPEGQSALSECTARVRRLSEVRVVSGYTARSGAGSETVFRQAAIVWATGRQRASVKREGLNRRPDLLLRREDERHGHFCHAATLGHREAPTFQLLCDAPASCLFLQSTR